MIVSPSRHGRSHRTRAAVLVLVLALLAAGCGGSGDDSADDSGGGGSETTADSGEPSPGGKVVYGLEAESSGGWCLPEAQLAIAGMQVARTVYDYLMVPNEDGEYVPFLAKSVRPNAKYDEWTIELREGIKFHDGTDLTAEVVKNNLDAFRGTYPARHPLLFVFVFDNVAETTVTGPLTLKVTTKEPWVSFPAYLFSNARFGISAQAQLDDEEHCDTNMIGTGPFMLDDWRPNDHLTVVKNPGYWREGYPYLDEIEYRPIADAAQMVNSIQGGEIDAMHTSSAESIAELRDIADSGDIQLTESDEFTETGYLMVNVAKPPFDNILARQAIAYAIDLETQNEVRNRGVSTIASGPFAPGNMGYLEDTDLPQFDLEKAKALVAQYEEETGLDFRFTLSHGGDPAGQEGAQFFIEMVEKAGVEVDSKVVDQSQGINDAIAGNFQATGWRNHPGGDPDTQYVWWHTGSPVNFGKFSDTEIDRLLEEGRSEPDPAKREQIYQDMNRRFAEQLYNLWSFWTLWAIATDTDVHGLLGPDLPDGSKPLPGLANGHAVDGLWVEE